MSPNGVKIESQLPIRGFLIIFGTLLVLIALTASILGENQKVHITARRMMENVAQRNYDEAYELLTENARQKIKLGEFKAMMSQLRFYLRETYGADFSQKYKFTSRSDFWMPWFENNRRFVSVGLYEKEPGVMAEFKEMVYPPAPDGPEIKNLFEIVRSGNRWLIDAIHFNPQDYPEVFKKSGTGKKDIFVPTEFGFNFEGFIYDKRTTTPQERAELIDALTQALDELKKDSGIQSSPSDDILKYIH